MGPIEGALVEPKKTSVAAHYRLVSEEERPRIKRIVDAVLEEHPDELKVTPGKMVYEVQPKGDWHKGKAVLRPATFVGLGRTWGQQRSLLPRGGQRAALPIRLFRVTFAHQQAPSPGQVAPLATSEGWPNSRLDTSRPYVWSWC
jgi:hypothetical protein